MEVDANMEDCLESYENLNMAPRRISEGEIPLVTSRHRFQEEASLYQPSFS